MNYKLASTILALTAVTMVSCVRKTRPVVEHHYHTTTYYRERPSPPPTYIKSAGVSGGSYSSSPEGFQAVTPPASFSQ